MKVYTLSVNENDFEFCEYDFGVIGVYGSVESAKKAMDEIIRDAFPICAGEDDGEKEDEDGDCWEWSKDYDTFKIRKNEYYKYTLYIQEKELEE